MTTQLALLNKNTGEKRAAAAQKAAADFTTLVPLFDLLFAKDGKNVGLVSAIALSLNKPAYADTLSKLCTIMHGLSSIATQLLNPPVASSGTTSTGTGTKPASGGLFAPGEFDNLKLDLNMNMGDMGMGTSSKKSAKV